MIYFTSDTHLGHKNIIKYCNRPFESVEEMDQTIINNWNKVVKKDDTVYHLGDFCSWSGKDYFKKYTTYRNSLNGQIFLVQGNHDKNIGAPFPYNLLGKVPLITIKHGGKKITLCHYAMRVWDGSHFDAWHLYGHSHATLDPQGKSYDVGVDNNAFTPISFDELKFIMKMRPHNLNWLTKLKGYNKEEYLEEKKKRGYDTDV